MSKILDRFLKKFSIAAHQKFLDRTGMTEDEYRALYRPFKEDCRQYAAMMPELLARRREFQDMLAASAVHRTFSTGGETLHRGLHCPSLIQDIVIGNNSRGKSCTQRSSRTSYTYYWDADDRMIAVREEQGIEYIRYDQNRTLGVSFLEDDMFAIAECEYDASGRIVLFAVLRMDSGDGSIYEYKKERYVYEPGAVRVEYALYDPFQSTPRLNLNRYVFSVEDGRLTEYVTEMLDCEDIRSHPADERTCAISIDRRI